LFAHHISDKANSTNEGKTIAHGSAKFYENHLNSFKDKKIKILEIGTFAGASAAAFVKYFSNVELYLS